MNINIKFPQYICGKTEDGKSFNALKLVELINDNTAKYYRNAGGYFAEAKIENNKIMVQILNFTPFEYFECTENEWIEDNAPYQHWDFLR